MLIMYKYEGHINNEQLSNGRTETWNPHKGN